MQKIRRILILSYSYLERDGRVQRQIRFLLELGHVAITAAAHGRCPIEDPRLRFLPLPRTRSFSRKLKAGLFLLSRIYRWYDPAFGGQEELYRRLAGERFDLILANDVETLAAAFALKTGACKVVLDAHEYEPRHYEERLQFRVLVQPWAIRLCRRYLPSLDGMMTVGEGIAQAYANEFGVRSQVVLNAPFFSPLTPSEVQEERIDLVYHGVVTPSRSPMAMLQLLALLEERFHLHLMLVATDSACSRQFLAAASGNPRVHRHEPVPPHRIAETINRFDIGLCILPPVNFNLIHSMPNKVLEFVQGRLGLAVWPNPEIAALVRRRGLGVVADDYTVESLAARLNRLSAAEIVAFKSASDRVARELSAETAGERVRRLVTTLLPLDCESDVDGDQPRRGFSEGIVEIDRASFEHRC